MSSWFEGLEAAGQRQSQPLGAPSLSLDHYRWANGVPRTERDDALKVNWCEVTITDAQRAARYRSSFITDWKITEVNVAGLVAAGRARWKFFQQLAALPT